MKRIAVSGACVVGVFVMLARVALSQAPAAGDPANGKRVFERDGCYQCHGYAGQGGRDGARLAATTMNPQSFIRYIRRPSGAMPAYTPKVLPDRELTDVFAYLKSMPAAKAAKDIPLLNGSREK